MKIVCDREKLLAAFQTAALFAPSRSPKEILTNIKLDVDKNGATFSATDMESSRYALGGVLFELEPNKITAVGTDGRRLAKMEGPAEAVNGHKTGDAMTIIRTPSLRAIGRSLSDADNEVHLAARGNDVLLR